MFKIIDAYGDIHEAYGAFPDEDGDIQFVLCNEKGEFYVTTAYSGFYKLYKEPQNDND